MPNRGIQDLSLQGLEVPGHTSFRRACRAIKCRAGFTQACRVNRLADYLLQYPQDIVATKRLLKYFQVSADEFQQALLSIDSRSHSINIHNHRG